MNITVCIGSGCHVRGSRKIIDTIQSLIAKQGLDATVDLEACFCQGHCTEGVVLKIDGELVKNVTPDSIRNILAAKLTGVDNDD